MKFTLPDVPKSEQTPLVMELFDIIAQLIEQVQFLQEQNSELKDEIRVLKGQKKRPVFKPSKLDALTANDEQTAPAKKKISAAEIKTDDADQCQPLAPDRIEIIKPADPIPPGSRFKGYKDFDFQELVLHSETVRYRMERWLTPDGQLLSGNLPAGLKAGKSVRHFGPDLLSYILYQHHHCQVTQPLLLEQLREWGFRLSSGQLDRLLTKDKECFHSEKDSLLQAGLSHGYVTVDDSGARHQGKNGYVTQIGNEFFAWFSSTESKSRLNYLTLLHAGHPSYCVNESALEYMQQQKLPQVLLDKFAVKSNELMDKDQWQEWLASLEISKSKQQRTVTEGALLGALLERDEIQRLAVVSDGAPQFRVLRHGLCWVHAERLVHTLNPAGEQQRKAVKRVRKRIWVLYRALKAYQRAPTAAMAKRLSSLFDWIFSQKTTYETLNRLLKRLRQHKDELLLVLERPEVPLHTNGSESDIRDYVKKRKVSGGTRSDEGKRCRDTFISLKKTCRKLRLSFWNYLQERIKGGPLMPLADLIYQRQKESIATT